VLVPALVRDGTGKLVYTLKADDFELTDDGVPQKLLLEPDSGGEPLALVVVVEVGGAGAREFQNYPTIAPPLAPMLRSIVGGVRHRVAVVTFDSQPRLLQAFTADVDKAADALRTLEPGCTRQEHFDNCTAPHPRYDEALGDNGAAILDALEFAVAQLRDQPSTYRRAILLVSETLDRGSKTTIAKSVREITLTNTTIYSVAYSTTKSEASHYAHHQLPTSNGGWQLAENARPNPPHGCMGKDPNPEPDDPSSRWAQAYDCLAQLAPPLTFAKMAAIATVDGLRQNVPETVARLTGGEYYGMNDLRSMEGGLVAIGNHLPNRYILSFQPEAPHPGLHQLTLKLPDYSGLEVNARTSYWVDAH
jgi:VWFA-related protein